MEISALGNVESDSENGSQFNSSSFFWMLFSLDIKRATNISTAWVEGLLSGFETKPVDP